jgi:hypothetical protein
MRIFLTLTIAAAMLSAQEQAAPPAERRGMPPRATPGDYQAHGDAGTVTVGAEFMQHQVPTPDGLLTTEDFIVVEAGVFGPAGARTTLNPLDFSLRVNGKKGALASEAYALVFKSIRDPEWAPDVPVDVHGKTSIGTGKGGGGGGEPAPPPPKPPLKLMREWSQRVQKAAFPEGDRALPMAGLLFFRFTGKASSIHTLELIYAGPAGKATLPLNP